MAGCQEMLENAYSYPLFSPFSAQFFSFSCRTAHSIFKVVYQASLIPKIRKIYGLVAETCTKTHIFHTFFTIFSLKKNFLAKLPMPYSKQYIRLVTYQKSEKSMLWLPRNAKKCIFFTPFSPFLAKNCFSFKNPAPSVFLNYKKLPLYQKSEQTMGPFERNLFGRRDGRTDGRMYECKSIVPPKFLGRSNKWWSIYNCFY